MAMIYSEGIGKTGQTAGMVAAVVGAILLAVGIAADAGGLAAVGLVLIILGSIVALTVFSMRRYSVIELDATTLRVGRDQLPVSELASVLDADQLPEDVLARATNPLPSKGPGGRLYGGGWGLGAAMKAVGFTTTSNPEPQVIGTKNPSALAEELRATLRSAT
jgi:hypothetical protein